MLRLILVVLATFTLSFSSDFSFAKEENYATEYTQALKQAKEKNKPIMAVFVTKMCPWCKKLENQTLKKNHVSSFIKANFIPLLLDKETSIFPKKFMPEVVPTTIFIRADEQKKFDEILGYKSADAFLKLLQNAQKRY